MNDPPVVAAPLSRGLRERLTLAVLSLFTVFLCGHLLAIELRHVRDEDLPVPLRVGLFLNAVFIFLALLLIHAAGVLSMVSIRAEMTRRSFGPLLAITYICTPIAIGGDVTRSIVLGLDWTDAVRTRFHLILLLPYVAIPPTAFMLSYVVRQLPPRRQAMSPDSPEA